MSDEPRKVYLAGMTRQFNEFRRAAFSGADHLFENGRPERPPVFVRAHREENVIVRPGAPTAELESVRGAIPEKARHRWFGSMRSSQALAQSIFANLWEIGALDVLAGLEAEDGGAAFFDEGQKPSKVRLEYEVDFLGEEPPRRTLVDVFIEGTYWTVIECKFSKAEVGSCSRPRLREDDPTFEQQYCDGSYTFQRSRKQRCALTSIGVLYWKYIPEVLGWPDDVDHPSCPLRYTYQLVRNVLAACLRDDAVDTSAAHALLLYDARNPAFQQNGLGMASFAAVARALRERRLLRRCS